MGICGSRNDPNATNSRKIERLLNSDARQKRDEVKLLLLGPGESGKSTLFKQMKILAREGGYTEEELLSYKYVICSNCISQMQVLSSWAIEHPDQVNFEKEENAQRVKDMMEVPAGGDGWSAKVADDIKELWADSGIQEVYNLRDKEFQLNESASYFFDNVERYAEPNHTPTKQDVLRARARSTGIEEAEFKFEELKFRMLDVGGQRSERRKWIHCFEGVTAVLFCASLSEYDQKLREDPTTNRMKESLLLFDEIVNSPWFRKTPIVLFLNKTDLFREKITRIDLKVCFPNYPGPMEFDAGADYIKERFLELPSDQHKPVYTHLTCAISTENVEVVFKVVKETLLREVLTNFML